MLDTSKIEGYAEMSAEEKVKALESLDFEKPDSDETTRLKNALNKASAEAADFKRQLREKQSEQERAEADAREKEEKIEKELAELRKEKEVSTYKANYLALGYDDELATKAAQAKADGDTATEFECQKTFNEKIEASHKAELIGNQPELSKGENPSGKKYTKEEIIAVKDRKERYRLIGENRDLFP